MIMEFLMAHAGIFMLALYKRRTLGGVLFLLLFYGTFIVAFGFAFKQPQVAAGAAALLLGRMLMLAFAPQRPLEIHVLRGLLVFVLYLFCMFLSNGVFSTGWREGIQTGVVYLIGPNPFMGHMVVAGSLYFLALAMLEVVFFLRGDHWVERLRAQEH
jgi:hypothetical protein